MKNKNIIIMLIIGMVLISGCSAKDGDQSQSKVNDSKSEGIKYDIKPAIKELNIIHDYLIYKYIDPEKIKDSVVETANNVNKYAEKHKDINFNFYYIETDFDIDFENSSSPHAIASIIGENLDRDLVNFDSFEIKTTEDYFDLFYKTDHHWNGKGQKKGYEDVVKLLSKEDEMLDLEIVTSDEPIMFGYKASFAGYEVGGDYPDIQPEKFSYIYPGNIDYDVSINGEIAEGYARYDLFEDLTDSTPNNSYIACFPTDLALVKFTNKDTRNDENLLVIGNSYTDSLKTAISQHYKNTYFLDARFYEETFGDTLNLDDFLVDNQINDLVIFNYAVTTQWGRID